MGENPAWVPTLLRVHDRKVDAWTGSAMGLRLLTRLGPRRTVKVLGALADLDAKAERESGERRGLSRKGFFKLGAGAGIAAGLVLVGNSQALASDHSKAKAWVEANKDNLPKTYNAFARHDLTHRKAIYAELDAATRSRLWTSHITAYREAHPELTAAQQRVLARAGALAGRTSTFAADRDREALHRELEQLRISGIDSFGEAEAGAILAMLGPRDVTPRGRCECSNASDYCGQGRDCRPGGCTEVPSDCGTLWHYDCNGMCRGV